MATIIGISEDDFETAVDVAAAQLETGGLLVYPTDTVYGLGCDATSEGAVRKVLALKGIRERKPLSVMMADFGMVEYYCETGIWEDITLKKYLPGPYTFILRQHRPLPASLTGRLGVRIPDSAFCQALCARLGRPVITTSANPTGRPAPVKFGGVGVGIIEGAGLAIDGGETKYGGPSIVIDLVDEKVMREGVKGIRLPER